MRRGTRVGQAYVAITADGDGINEDIVDAVDDAGPGVEKAGKDHGERYGDQFSGGFLDRIRSKFKRGAISSQMGDEGNDSGKQFTDRFESHFDNAFLDRLGARVGGHMLGSIISAIDREKGMEDNPIADLFDRWMDDAVSGNGKGRGGGSGKKAGLGAMVGAMFGAGSRSEGLNIFGKSVGGITSLLDKLFLTLGRAPGVVAKFVGSLSEIKSAGDLMTKLGSGTSGFFSKIATTGPAAVAAIVAVVAALSIMASVLGAVLGIVTALAATITAALVGSLAVLGGAMAAVVAAGGLLTAAFMSMTDAQTKLLKDAFQPLKAEMVGIGQIMLNDMVPAFATWSANLQEALMAAVPVAHVMGEAFAEAGNRITASFSGPGFQLFAQALTTYLPGIVIQLSNALGSFLNGLLGLFAALMPQVSRFSYYLAEVAARFSNWATSAQGQNAITMFVDRAVVSLQALWNFVGSFVGFLADVLFSPEAMNAGNTIFDGLARTFDGFREKVAQASADGSLQRWFDDAIRFGSQLWSVIEALGGTFMALYNSGVINAIGDGLGGLASVIGAINQMLGPMVSVFGGSLGAAISIALGPISVVTSALEGIGRMAEWALGKIGVAVSAANAGAASFTAAMNIYRGTQVAYGDAAANGRGRAVPSMPTFDMAAIQKSGNAALNATSVDRGGYKPKAAKGPKKYRNPYKKFAESLIAQSPTVASQMKTAMMKLNKSAAAGIRAAARETGGKDGVVTAMDSLTDSLKTGVAAVVDTARQALSSSAQDLANASSKGEARAALAEVRKAQKNLRNILTDQKHVNTLAANLAKQKVVKQTNVNRMVAGMSATNITLAEFAEARLILADRIDAANQKLADAISMRDEYRDQITESVKSFASLASASAASIDGVEQALTANDITTNLQTRLDKIRKFQTDLQLLLANGLSGDAYKQIVDEGVEGGTVLADALLAGGSAAIQQTNSLVGQINDIAGTLGSQTSNRLYQAGVDAAQGLVDGLTSLSAKLDAAAAKLGESIALSIKRTLGIKSPSTVMRALMGPVGDGAVLGLNDQQVKVSSAAAVLAGLISVNPGGPPANGGPPVSGNGGQLLGDLHIHTPTEDPKAVANEAINELVGRL